MLNWYLVQLQPNGHKLAKANLERQGFNTFLPLQNVTKSTAQKFMDRTVPLFAGYMFVELEVAQNSWRKVNSTLGVARIVSLGGTPTPVP
jgi:transcriptional antiterminator RfaH